MNNTDMKYNDKISNLQEKYPYTLIDKIEKSDSPGKSLTGIFYLDKNLSFFAGHFPGNPIFPGVLQLMSFRQLADILYTPEEAEKLNLINMTKVRYQKPVKPGSIFTAVIEEIQNEGGSVLIDCKATVNDQLVTKAKIKFIKF